MIYKRCSRCGKRIPSGSKCECLKGRHQEYDRFSRDKKSKEFYGSGEWEKARENALEADAGIDVYVYMTTGEVLAADTVHHITPLRDDWRSRNDIDNLMSLSSGTHSVIEALYKQDKEGTKKKLYEMLTQFRRKVRAGAV